MKISPMLAFEYQQGKVEFPAYVQPKIDGVRCIIDKDGIYTRNGNPIRSCDHISAELAPFFKLNSTCILDGEIFSDDLPFEEIAGAVRSKSPCESLMFVAFDSVWGYRVLPNSKIEWVFSDRMAMLTDAITKSATVKKMRDSATVKRKVSLSSKSSLMRWISPSIKLLPAMEVHSHEEIELELELFTSAQYQHEGIMVRENVAYKQGRTTALQKWKKFYTQEFEILGVEEGSGKRAGMAGAFLLNIDGNDFKASANGRTDLLQWYWRNRKKLIGQQVTVKFQEFTQRGVPRFPVTVSIRNYE